MKLRVPLTLTILLIVLAAFSFTPNVSAAINVDGSGCVASGTGVSLTCSFTHVADVTVLIVIITNSADSVSITSMTVGGVSATAVSVLYFIYRASAATENAVVNFSGQTPHGSLMHVVSFSGVSQPVFYDNLGSSFSSTTTETFTVSTGTIPSGVAGRRLIQIVGAVCDCAFIGSIGYGSGQVEIYNSAITTGLPTTSYSSVSYLDTSSAAILNATISHATSNMGYGVVWLALLPEDVVTVTATSTSVSTTYSPTVTVTGTSTSTVPTIESSTTITSTTTSTVSTVSVYGSTTSTTISGSITYSTTTGQIITSPNFVGNLVIVGFLLVMIPLLFAAFTGVLGFIAVQIVMTIVCYVVGVLPWPIALTNGFFMLVSLLLYKDSGESQGGL